MTLIYRPIYWFYRAIAGLWRWSRRRFTQAGLCVVGGFIVAGAMGVDVENTVTYQSFTLLLGFLLAAFACSFFFRGKFSATRFLPRFGIAGQPLRYRIAMKNLTAKNQTGLTLLEDIADPPPSFVDWVGFRLPEGGSERPFRAAQRRQSDPFRVAILKESGVAPLPAHGEAETSMEVIPLRRGVLRFTGVTLARPDPFGLFRSFIKVRTEKTVLILPRRYPIPHVALPGALSYQQGGMAFASNAARGEEFVSLREYRHGDPLRHVHWRSWAKAGKPLVKEFEDGFYARHALVLDTFVDEPNSEVLEEAVSVAASFACAVLTQESLLDVLFVGHQSNCFTAGRGLGGTDQILEILAALNNCADKEFEALEQLVLTRIADFTGCICVLQSWDEARKRFMEKLRALGVPLLVLVVVPPGQDKLDAGPLRDQQDRFHTLEIGRIAETLAELK